MTSQELTQKIFQKQSFLCVGLDTDPDLLPRKYSGTKRDILRFNREIIESTKDYAVAYKFNTAFYEAMGPVGFEILGETLEYIPKGIFTIADAKRSDIGNTAQKYARAFFEVMNFDAVTLSPYMGRDSVEPFLSYRDKWAIILALTSNPGSLDFQYIEGRDGVPLWLSVARECSKWGNPDNIMLVVGANRVREMKTLRENLPDYFFLVPGVGHQGGDLGQIFSSACHTKGPNILVNASRSIIYSRSDSDLGESAEGRAKLLQGEMAKEMKVFLDKP